MTAPRISVVVVSYQSRRYLETCVSALLTQSADPFEVILVDNGSTDGGPEEVERLHPGVRVVRSPVNRHYTGGNNLGFAEARGELLASVNVDTEVAPGWLAALAAALDAHPDAGLVTSRVCLLRQRDHLNTCGNLVHVSGLGFCRGLGLPSGSFPRLEEVPAISGSAFMTRRRVIDELGGFDEDFFAYVEDTDLSLRAALAGHRILYVPESVVFHDYELAMRPEKFYLLERNRLMPLIKVFRPRTLLALAPALALGELMTLTFALKGGRQYLAAKGRAWRWLLQHRATLRRRHADAQTHRRVSDGALLRRLTAGIPADQLGLPRPLARVMAPVATAAFSLAMLPARLLVR